MISKDISLRVIASLTDYRRELEKMPDMTAKEAKKATLAMQREFAKAEVAAAVSATKAATQQATAALDGMGSSAANTATKLKLVEDGAGRTESITRALGGALGMLSPELQGVAAVGAEAAGGVEAILKGGTRLAPILGTLTLAVGAGALAWKHYSDELKEAEEWQRKQAEAAADAQRVHEALADAELDLSVMLGKVTAEEAAMTRGRARGMELVQPLIDKNTEAIERLRRESETLAGVGGVFFVQNRDAIERNQREINKLSDANQNLTGKGIALGVSLSGVTEKHKTATTAARAHKDVNDDLARTMADLQARVSAEDNPFAQVDAEVAALERLRVEAGVTAEHLTVIDQRLAQLTANRAEMQAEQLEATREREEEAAAAREAEQKRLDDARASAAREQRALEQANNAAAIGGINDVMSATQALIALRVESGDLTKEEARKAFAFQKAAGIAQVAINTAIAITKALAQLGPVAGGFAAAGITAMGAAQAATIAAQQTPSYHTGGVYEGGLDPSERMAKVRTGEGILTAKGVDAVGGAEGVRRLNGSGSAAAPSRTVIEMRVDGRTADRIVYTAARKGSYTREVLAALRPSRRVNPYSS
jgi:hypothetical protein